MPSKKPTVCANCNKSNSSSNSISCDRCSKLVHYTCLGITPEEADIMLNSRSKSINVKLLCIHCTSDPDFNDQIKTFADLLENFKKYVDDKFAALEAKVAAANTFIPPPLFEELVNEAMDRIDRQKNVMIYDLPESDATSTPLQQQDDKQKVLQISIAISEPLAQDVVRVQRMGTRRNNASRPVKVTFSNTQSAINLLRSKKRLANTHFSKIPISADQSPVQRKFLKDLRVELQQRIDNGEEDITIKYIKSVPTIVNKNAKKSLN